MQNHAITISNTTIRQDEHGRFCLNDLHRAAGGEPKHSPSRWLRNQQTKDLIEEISKSGIPALEITQIRVIETIQKKGTFSCRELVYCYAMWISPIFHLKVIRAYDALVTGVPAVHHQQLGLAREIGQIRDQMAQQGKMVIALFERLDAARRGQVNAQAKLARTLERERNLLAVIEKRQARDTIIKMEAEGYTRDVICVTTGRTLNHVRQVIFQAKRDGYFPVATQQQGELGLTGGAA